MSSTFYRTTHSPFTLFFFILFLLLFNACSHTCPSKDDSSASVSKTGWASDNLSIIEKMIENHGATSPLYDLQKKPLVTLDWDNTVIFNDIGEATYLYMTDHLLFSYNKAFWELFPLSIKDKIKQSYEQIVRIPAATRAQSPAYQIYRKSMIKSYWLVCQEKGLEYCTGWVSRILVGLTPKQIRLYSRQSIERELLEPIRKESIGIGAHDPNPIRVNRGIRFYGEMHQLVEKLKKSGFDVWIVSASNQWAVESAASYIGIQSPNVLGVLPSVGSDGRVQNKIVRLTFRSGKRDAINRYIKRPPIFAAGDSDNDIEMLLTGTGPRLIIDRGKRKLSELARKKNWMIQPQFISRNSSSKK